MMNLLSGISVWAAYGAISAAGVLLCSHIEKRDRKS